MKKNDRPSKTKDITRDHDRPDAAGAGVARIPLALTALLILVIPAGLWFISPYLGVVIFAALIAYIVSPVYGYISQNWRRLFLVFLVLLSFLSFIPLGAIYGPVFMILIVTTLHMYAEANRKRQRPGLPQPEQGEAA